MTHLENVWLADLTYTQQGVSADLMPAAIGGIALFCEQELGLKNSIQLFKYPEILADQLSKGQFPSVIGFSCYIWNMSLSYGFARRIKALSPSTLVVFGGPNFPLSEYSQKDWLIKYPAIDVYIKRRISISGGS